MYIGSTNLYLDLVRYNRQNSPSWMAHEKYENCEDFYELISAKNNKSKRFYKKNKNA
ncbi:MAG: PINc domain-containing protein [Lachnoclostridium sp.]|jgi:hypothetical protein